MGNPVEILWVLAGNHQQYEWYVRDSYLDSQYTRYVDSPISLFGVRFNISTVLRPVPQGTISRVLRLEPKFVEIESERVNRMIVFGTWRDRRDLHSIRKLGRTNGFQLPL